MTWFLLAASSLAKTLPKPTPAEQQRAALSLQRAAIHKQAESLGLWMLPGAPLATSEPPTCEPIAETAVTPLIEEAAKAQSIETRLIQAVIERESAFRPCAISPKGAQGLMQLMPETAGELGVHDPFDPKENIQAGSKYLKQLLDRFKGDLPHALGAYNAGPNAVDQSGGVPDIPETKDYVDAILKKLGITRTAPPSSPTPKPIGN